MEKIDLSSNARKIENAYLNVVSGKSDINYVVYTVDKAFVVDVEESGNGSLDEFVETFSDGHVQFGLARVKVPGSEVYKNLLVGWCPDNVSSKARLSFASNFTEISNVLQGYHVQITARDPDDLDVDEFLSKVSAAAGTSYSGQSSSSKPSVGTSSGVKPAVASSKPSPAPKPTVKPTPSPAAKPSFIPKSTGNPINVGKPSNDDDEWGGEGEIKERDFEQNPLEDVPSAYKPTKVDIDDLRKQKSDTVTSQPRANKPQESSPEPTKPKTDEEPEAPQSFKDKFAAYTKNEDTSDGRLTSMPKPKVNNSVASRFNAATADSGPSFGAKPSFGPKPTEKKPQSGGISRNFASEGGKSPAQIWAEKKGKYTTVPSTEKPVSSATSSNELEEKFNNKLKVNEPESEPEPESQQEPEPEPKAESEAESEPVREQPKFEPPIIKPSAGSFPPKSEPEPEEEEQEEEEEEKEEPPAPLPARNLPPPPARNVGSMPPPPPTRNVETVPPPPVREPEPQPEPKKETPSAIAEYTYEKDEDNEIGFDEGDLIIEIDFVDDDWWQGKHSNTGEVGLFPASYVSLKESDDSAPIEQSKEPEPEPQPEPEPVASPSPAPAPPSLPLRGEPPKSDKPSATAEFSYERDEDNEVGFEEGDVIIEIEFVDDDWWQGKHSTTGEVGLFPANYVKLNN